MTKGQRFISSPFRKYPAFRQVSSARFIIQRRITLRTENADLRLHSFLLAIMARRSVQEEEAIIPCLLLRRRRRRRVTRRNRQRTMRARKIFQQRPEQGEYHQLLQEMRPSDLDSHFKYIRMTKERFDSLLAEVNLFFFNFLFIYIYLLYYYLFVIKFFKRIPIILIINIFITKIGWSLSRTSILF